VPVVSQRCWRATGARDMTAGRPHCYRLSAFYLTALPNITGGRCGPRLVSLAAIWLLFSAPSPLNMLRLPCRGTAVHLPYRHAEHYDVHVVLFHAIHNA